MNFDTIFFDLDSTLYPESNGLWQRIRERIDLYMQDKLGFSADEIPEIRHKLFIDHGTTLKGLQINYNVDPNDYLDFVHDLPLHDYLEPDPELREMLLGIPRRRWILTNSDAPHATRVINILGISDCFEGIIDVWRMDPHVKPMKEAYRFALDLIGGAAPNQCALLDDSPRNLETAKEMGIFTILVGQDGNSMYADRTIINIHDLQKAVPEFWGIDKVET
jgi:pyrimidine 5'-nucleotidase